MYKLNNIKEIHLETTSKCQARCPMCPRRPQGGPLNPYVELNEITLETFKQWFNIDFVKQLSRLFMCGNLGDPIVAKDTLEIYQYLRDNNPSIILSMNTNGSAKDTQWWEKLAKLNVRVIFGIDGLADTHQLYRVSTDYHKIIENAKHFINAGGNAEWHMLAFKHNEHQIEYCEQLSKELGFTKFEVKHTSRFQKDSLSVIDNDGKTVHIIEPTQRSKELRDKVLSAINVDSPNILCKAQKYSQLYIGSDGTVSPCCWLDVKWFAPMNESRIDYMDQIGEFPNLNNNTLEEIFDSKYFDKIESTWNNNPLKECSKQCGVFDKFGEQFK